MKTNQRLGAILNDQWGAGHDVTQMGDVGVAEEAEAANWEDMTPVHLTNEKLGLLPVTNQGPAMCRG